jgi:hypothetical protein
MLAIANGIAISTQINKNQAQEYLEEVVVHNLEFAFKQLSEESRTVMTDREIKKSCNLMGFIISEIDLNGVYDKLAIEIKLICEQRPVMTRKARELIKLVYSKTDISPSDKAGKLLDLYVNAIYFPSEGVKNYTNISDYESFLDKCNKKDLTVEANEMGHYMKSTGLVSEYHSVLLRKLISDDEELVPECMDLSETGKAEWIRHKDFISTIIFEIVGAYNYQCIYGLSRMLEKGLFSRRAVRVGIENLRKIKINPQVERRIIKSIINPGSDVSPLKYLIGGLITVLGQPLGVGQGNNPTCQSARGISMWSRHAPAKLIDMVITVATQNNLVMRFENQDLISNQLEKGLMDKLDYDLDVVSVILIPHLDKIYNEMMKRAAGRGEDPHKWVNPAMYGQWIQIGFASVYDYLSNSILDYEGFVRIFYAAFNLKYNGDHHMVYPNPVGIFITNAKGEMVGFHAVSLLRVEQDQNGEVRAYFLNPNNEGRQDWGQEIRPSVYGKGEKHGESSLPFHEFSSRVYAFHFNQLEVTNYLHSVPDTEIKKVENLARVSWGKSYVWNNQSKIW